MRVLLVLVLLGAAGWFVYHRMQPSAAVVAYETMVTGCFKGEATCGDLTEPKDPQKVIHGSLWPRYYDSYRHARFDVKEEREENGETVLRAVQSVYYDPPGATSTGGAYVALIQHDVHLVKSGERWLVRSLATTELKTLEVRSGTPVQ